MYRRTVVGRGCPVRDQPAAHQVREVAAANVYLIVVRAVDIGTGCFVAREKSVALTIGVSECSAASSHATC